jgi:hypothetical protein
MISSKSESGTVESNIQRICYDILLNIINKLQFMPMSLRYLCAIMSHHAIKYVYIHTCILFNFFQFSKGDPEAFHDPKEKTVLVRKIIGDLLFVKWWIPCMLSPDLHGIMKICVVDDGYRKNFIHIVKILKAIISGKPLLETSQTHKNINKFIMDVR